MYALAAEKGISGARFNLGNRYQDGIGVEINFNRCVELLEQSAKQGHLDAQFNLSYFTSSCLDCIPGRYTSEPKQTKCIDCEVGRASEIVARVSECDICSSGRYQPTAGTTSCLDCI